MNGKLKIIQVATPYLEVKKENIKSGITTICRQLTEQLIKKGHRVVLFAPRGSKTSAKLIESTNLAFDYSKIVHPYKNDLLHLFSILAFAVKYAQKNNFDIIHSHLPLVAPAINLISSLPIVTTMHWGNFLPEQQDYFKIIPYHYSIAISCDQKKRLSKFIKFFDTVYNGIDLNDFKFNPKPKNYFVWLGGINELKGTYETIKVAKAAKINLKIFGTIRDRKYFAKRVKPYLGKNIIYGGEVITAEKRNKILREARALLFTPNWHEPFGLTLAEAQACGTPVLTLDKGSAKEVVKSGKTGFVVKNLKEMIKAIFKIGEIRRSSCREFVEKNFSSQKMILKYELVYKKVILGFKKHKT